MPRKKGEQTDFRAGGIHGIKAEAFFYYHSIIKRKQHKSKAKSRITKEAHTIQKYLRRSKKWQTG
jgi:Leu/Phe-tRNA-protein transferase